MRPLVGIKVSCIRVHLCFLTCSFKTLIIFGWNNFSVFPTRDPKGNNIWGKPLILSNSIFSQISVYVFKAAYSPQSALRIRVLRKMFQFNLNGISKQNPKVQLFFFTFKLFFLSWLNCNQNGALQRKPCRNSISDKHF